MYITNVPADVTRLNEASEDGDLFAWVCSAGFDEKPMSNDAFLVPSTF
jgi:hypothetical protein